MFSRIRPRYSFATYAFLLVFSSLAVRMAWSDTAKVLRWKLGQGEVIDVDLHQKMNSSTTMFGNPMQSGADIALKMQWVVLGVDAAGTLEMQQSVRHIRMKMESPGTGTVEFDTEQAAELTGMAKVLCENVQPIIGLKLIQRMNARGEILDVRLTDEAQQQLARSGGGGLKEVFSPESMKMMLNQSAAVLPDKPVRPGDTWRATTEIKNPSGTIVMHLDYTYRGTEANAGRDLERIDIDVKTEVAEAAKDNGFQMTIKDQQSQGCMFFDASAGRFVESRLTQRMTLESQLGQTSQEQNLQTEMAITFQTAPQPAPREEISLVPVSASLPAR